MSTKTYFEVVVKKIAVVLVEVSDDIPDDATSDPYELAREHIEFSDADIAATEFTRVVGDRLYEDEADIRTISQEEFETDYDSVTRQINRRGQNND